MRVVLWACLVVIGFGLNSVQQCFPPSCKIDANCEDNIHGFSGKCCGGVCQTGIPSNRGVGETCSSPTPSNSNNFFESCGGTCGTGLFCSEDDKRCHIERAVGCNCTRNSECQTGLCDGKCAILKHGEICSTSNRMICGSAAYCRYNFSVFSYTCFTRCAAGVANCCSNNADCQLGLTCSSGNGTCYQAAPPSPPGLGEACSFSNTCRSPLICEQACNSTVFSNPCVGSNDVCQNPNSFALGQPCVSDLQCPTNARCYSNTSMNVCQARGNATTGSPCSSDFQCASAGDLCVYNGTGSFCMQNGTVGANQPCFGYNTLCAGAGAVCASNGTSSDVCRLRNAVPNGGYCNSDSECFLGSYCVQNGTGRSCMGNGTVALNQPCYGYSVLCATRVATCTSNGTSSQVCRANGTVPNGEYCNTFAFPTECINGSQCLSSVCQRMREPGESCVNGGATCRNGGAAACAPPQFNSTASCSFMGNCYCVTPAVVPDGKECNVSIQCQSIFSSCYQGKCAPIAGRDCDSVSECGTGTPTYDCGCNRKCYILNNPTPAPTPVPTAAPTPPTPGRCDAKRDVWLNFSVDWTWSPAGTGYISSDYYQCPDCGSNYDFVQRALKLNTTAQAALIDYACCMTCVGTFGRFYTQLEQGYQVDCAAKTLTKLPDTCNSLRNSPALANCWAATVSSATTSTLGLGALIFAALLY